MFQNVPEIIPSRSWLFCRGFATAQFFFENFAKMIFKGFFHGFFQIHLEKIPPWSGPLFAFLGEQAHGGGGPPPQEQVSELQFGLDRNGLVIPSSV